MEIKKLIFILTILNLYGCTTNVNRPANFETINFYNYAQSICIGSAFNIKEVKEDANRAANGYMESGNISLNAYQELRDRVDVWLAKKYISKTGKSLQIMKCNDFYHSGEIQGIYQKYDPCKTTDGWLDITDYNKQCN